MTYYNEDVRIKKIIASACLCGINCRYDGKCVKNNLTFKEDETLKICPEVLGGLNIPRESCEIVGGNAKDVLNRKAKIIGKSGTDYTEEYLAGINKAIKIIEKYDVKLAYLKQNSPSCGYGIIYDGTFENKKIRGNGIFAEKLKEIGIKIISI